MKLKVPRIIGFGISDSETYKHACSKAEGAIIGSAFVKAIEQKGDLKETIRTFIAQIRN
jgi:tryptophan synthase alpha chain